MSASYSFTYKELCKKIKDAYGVLTKENIKKFMSNSNETCDEFKNRIELLNKLENGEKFSNYYEKELFLRIILDIIGTSRASGAKKGEIKIKNRDLFARKKDLKGEFKDNDNFVSWSFAKLVQGWLSNKTSQTIKDLRLQSKFKNSSCADFLVNNEIVECKRLHKGKSGKIEEEELIKKLVDNFLKANSQIKKTLKQLGKNSYKTTIILDLSVYSQEKHKEKRAINQIVWYGYKKKQIEKIARRVKNFMDNPLADQIILCWDKFIYINKNPKGIIQNSIRLYKDKCLILKNYGWTASGYSLSTSSKYFGDLRVSSQAKSLGIINTHYNNHSDKKNFWEARDWRKNN